MSEMIFNEQVSFAHAGKWPTYTFEPKVTTASRIAIALAAPFLGLGFVLALPLIGLSWTAWQALKGLTPLLRKVGRVPRDRKSARSGTPY